MSHDLEDFLDQMSAEISAEYRRIQRSALASIFHEAMWCERLGLVCLRLQD